LGRRERDRSGVVGRFGRALETGDVARREQADDALGAVGLETHQLDQTRAHREYEFAGVAFIEDGGVRFEHEIVELRDDRESFREWRCRPTRLCGPGLCKRTFDIGFTAVWYRHHRL